MCAGANGTEAENVASWRKPRTAPRFLLGGNCSELNWVVFSKIWSCAGTGESFCVISIVTVEADTLDCLFKTSYKFFFFFPYETFFLTTLILFGKQDSPVPDSPRGRSPRPDVPAEGFLSPIAQSSERWRLFILIALGTSPASRLERRCDGWRCGTSLAAMRSQRHWVRKVERRPGAWVLSAPY